MPVNVEFEPVKLGPRHRRVDPLAIGALIVVLGVVAAVLKPWNQGDEASASGSPAAFAESTSAASAPSPAAPSSPAAALPRVSLSTAASASWADVRGAVRSHNAWGIRVIVAEPSASLAGGMHQQFAEHWTALPEHSEGIPIVDIEPNDRTVVAIGTTFPASHTPLDTRIWLIHPD